jgi:hypothetical protein
VEGETALVFNARKISIFSEQSQDLKALLRVEGSESRYLEQGGATKKKSQEKEKCQGRLTSKESSSPDFICPEATRFSIASLTSGVRRSRDLDQSSFSRWTPAYHNKRRGEVRRQGIM